MLSRSLRVTCPIALHPPRPHVPTTVRTLTTTATRQADPIQDIYVKHLREYKPSPVKPGDAEQHVHRFSAPSGFHSPEEPNLPNELSAYQNQTVEVEGQATQQQTTTETEQQQDWFEHLEDFEAEDHAAAGGSGH